MVFARLAADFANIQNSLAAAMTYDTGYPAQANEVEAMSFNLYEHAEENTTRKNVSLVAFKT